MTTRDDVLELGTLRALAIRGFADNKAIAKIVGEPERIVAATLTAQAQDGLVKPRGGRVVGWSLTAEGRAVVTTALARQRVESGTQPDLEAGYEAFLTLNQPIKQLCTDWQLQGQPARCIKELASLHTRLVPWLTRLSIACPWFGMYVPRFADALGRLRGGDADAFTQPLSGSYHDIWMELHQDLLLALGRTRSDSDGH